MSSGKNAKGISISDEQGDKELVKFTACEIHGR
jgi:hypothetical protein